MAENSSYDGDSKCGISGHYYVDRDGKVYRYIEDNRIAHHVISYNQRSIGIEFVNFGRYPNWYSTETQVCTEEYSDAQIKTAVELMYYLKRNIPSLQLIRRHSDLDTRWVVSSNNTQKQVRRKIDPGPLFPWNKLEMEWSKVL